MIRGRFVLTALRISFCMSLAFVAVVVVQTPGTEDANVARAYLGFDLNAYPGDDALPVLRKDFTFAGFWLGPPPGAKSNSWLGKRQLVQAQGFGFLLLYSGRDSKELKNQTSATQKGTLDAKNAAAAAKREGFAPQSVIFLDIEEGGRLPDQYHAYLRAWIDGLSGAGYQPGVYCSGMLDVRHGVTVKTADDIRNKIGSQELVYWVYNDACPPSPGCVFPPNPPAPTASGVPYALVWQISQSPRRKQFAARCAATYNTNGNCYAPSDAAHKWFLDIDVSRSPDPSAPKR